jgi:hypothetical protein
MDTLACTSQLKKFSKHGGGNPYIVELFADEINVYVDPHAVKSGHMIE